MSPTTCPADDDLLAVATGEEVTPLVRSHVDTCTDCQQRLGQMAAEVSNLRAAVGELDLLPAGDTTVYRPASPPPPAAVGKYLVLDVLGRGAQGEVYRALHPTLAKEVVIKLARPSCKLDRPDRDRLLAEGKILADLDHPYLARVHDLDFHEGCPFLVMEYVRGRTLHEHAEEQRPPPRQAAALVAHLARALAVAHHRGVVHQDLKPRNILVDEAGRPRIIDFGLARLVHGWADPRRQPEGGTVAYMAPEQARGETERIGARTDTFALGAVLYFLLAGRAPFAGRDRLEEFERAQRCDFDRAALRTAKVPRRLEAICLRAMAPEPADRYARAEDLAADLERFVRRPRQAAVLAGIGLVAVLGWSSWKGWQAVHVHEGLAQLPSELQLPKDALSLRLVRNNQIRELQGARGLASAAPLRTGDELKVQVLVAQGLHASLFWIGSRGELEHLADARPGDVLSYPAASGEFKVLQGPSGTEAVLVCWCRSAPVGIDELRDLWGTEQSWPALPSQSVLRVDRDGVEEEQRGRPLGPSRFHVDPVGDVRARLDQLRLRLAGRVDFLAGVAFAHTEGSASP